MVVIRVEERLHISLAVFSEASAGGVNLVMFAIRKRHGSCDADYQWIAVN